MAGMFYSLQEVMTKLQNTEEQIKEIVRQGRLREFRDGPNLLFKVDEVESLMLETKITAPKQPPAEEPAPELVAEEPIAEIAEEPFVVEELTEEPLAEELELTIEPPAPKEPAGNIPRPELMDSEDMVAQEPVEEEEISLAPEPTEEMVAESDFTGGDTAIAAAKDEEFDILSQSDDEASPLNDDTLGETKITSDETKLAGSGEMSLGGSTLSESPLMSTGSGEASLEEIEEDVNLDSFGSGSGLLDLSLQADDTSLGGILDEIYTSDEIDQDADASQGSAAASAMEVAADTEDILGDSPQTAFGPGAMAKAYVEPEPDKISNAFGVMMIIPLLTVIYAAIIITAGFCGVMPSIFAPILKFIWYIMGGLAALSLVIVGLPLLQSSGGPKAAAKPKSKKAKKEKKPKKPKAKKEKKPKKAK